MSQLQDICILYHGYADMTTAIDRSRLFRTAWAQARFMVQTYGGTARKWFAGCLKGAWKRAKAALVALVPPAGVSAHIGAMVVRQRIAPAAWRFANSRL
jgi:hypothetical protein